MRIRKVGLTAIIAGLCVLVSILVMQTSLFRPDRSVIKSAARDGDREQTGTPTTLPVMSDGIPGQVSSRNPTAGAVRSTTQSGTAQSLAAKGLSATLRIREHLLQRVSRETLPELVLDIGNVTVRTAAISGFGSQGYPALPATWQPYLTRSIINLRLIEEGRDRPDEVVPLLHESLRKTMAEYPAMRAALSSGISKGVQEDDPYYNANFHYDNPGTEVNRVSSVLYSDFYVLANLDRLDASAAPLLRQFLEMNLLGGYDCLELKVWMVDCYAQAIAKTNPAFYAAHNELLNGVRVCGEKVTRSRWNASWDRDHFLLDVARVNVQDIETIQVLDTPSKRLFAEDKMQRVIDHFLERPLRPVSTAPAAPRLRFTKEDLPHGTKALPDGKFAFNYTDIPAIMVLTEFSEVLECAVITDRSTKLEGKITMVNRDGLTRDDAVAHLNSSLAAIGYNAAFEGEKKTVLRISERSPTPAGAGGGR